MSRFLVVVMFMIAFSLQVYAQGKGVDKQSENIRDAGSDRTPANNGAKQDVGAGRGFDFGRGRTPATVALPNPSRITIRLDVLRQTLEELMRERKLILDVAASKPEAGIFISQPYTFSKGSIVTDSELNRFAVIPATSERNFTRGRYTLIIEVQPIDGISSNVSANARVEGRAESISGPEWLTLPSSGIVEQDFLVALLSRLNALPLETPSDRP